MLPNTLDDSRLGGPAITEPAEVAACVGGFGLRIARPLDVSQARRLAADLIGPDIVTTPALQAIQAKTLSTVLVFDQGAFVTGMLAVAQLSARGLTGLQLGSFDVLAGRLEDYAAPGETPFAIYALGIAAATREAARATVGAVVRLRFRLFANLPFFARAASAAGRRVLTERLCCRELRPNLYWSGVAA